MANQMQTDPRATLASLDPASAALMAKAPTDPALLEEEQHAYDSQPENVANQLQEEKNGMLESTIKKFESQEAMDAIDEDDIYDHGFDISDFPMIDHAEDDEDEDDEDDEDEYGVDADNDGLDKGTFEFN